MLAAWSMHWCRNSRNKELHRIDEGAVAMNHPNRLKGQDTDLFLSAH